jgi:hypothetical protein
VLGTLAGCGAGEKVTGSTKSTGPLPVATVIVNPPTTTAVAGQQMPLTATLKDAAGKTLAGRTVSWTTRDSAVARVTGEGMLTAVAPGSTTVTATSEGISGSAAVTVNPNLTFAFLTSGGEHTCAVTAVGAAYCWGSNVYEQLDAGARSWRIEVLVGERRRRQNVRRHNNGRRILLGRGLGRRQRQHHPRTVPIRQCAQYL